MVVGQPPTASYSYSQLRLAEATAVPLPAPFLVNRSAQRLDSIRERDARVTAVAMADQYTQVRAQRSCRPDPRRLARNR